MTEEEIYQTELLADQKTEKLLWIKECVVFAILVILVLIREYVLDAWFIA